MAQEDEWANKFVLAVDGDAGDMDSSEATTMTRSEELFELFCFRNGIRITRVQAGHEKTPDYMMLVGNQSIVVEVKQFDAGSAEKKTLQKPAEDLGECDAFWDGVPGQRVRSKIDTAMPQLKHLSGGVLPTLLVLYDNVCLWPEICDQYAVGVAMYGIETALISKDAAPEGGATILSRWHGGCRRTTSRANTSLSAIALLSREDDDQMTITVFHNYFAQIPFCPNLLRGQAITHHHPAANPENAFVEWTIC